MYAGSEAELCTVRPYGGKIVGTYSGGDVIDEKSICTGNFVYAILPIETVSLIYVSLFRMRLRP